MRLRSGVVAVCFFLSGATGLVYQVVWLRMLGLVFGHGVHAITAVLAAFMAGLALGSFVFARRAARIHDLVRAYGLMEVGIGLYCAAIPLLFWLASLAYLRLHRALDLSFGAFTAVQFGLILAALLVPTTLMGGTLPVLSQALARDDAGLGRTISFLYGLNTLGAVAGTVAAGYVVLPALGNRLTVAVAATANVAVGALAIAYARSSRARGLDSPAAAPPGEALLEHEAAAVSAPATPGQLLGARLTVAALAVSGAVSMVYEVAWTRALALVLGSSTYAFTSMLAAFLVGIAAGSVLYGWLRGARRASPASFGVLQLATGLGAALVFAMFERLPELFLLGLRWSHAPSAVQALQLAISVSALLVFTVFIGATFPCAVAVASRSAHRAGRDVGHVYAMNTVGAIAGSMVAGFVLVPRLGMQAAIALGIAANFALAAVLFLVPPGPLRRRALAAAGALAAAAATTALPSWDPRVVTAAPAVYGRRLLQTAGGHSLAAVLRPQETVLFYRDGPSATVSVVRAGKTTSLKVNGKTDASDAADMPTQVLVGHVPLLARPGAESALVIGLGSGVTAGAIARHPVKRLDVAELEPAVVEANRFFADLNGHALSDRRVRLVVGDGRNVLLTSRARYDVIVSEPSNPWISGLASLFTVEFFGLARERLRPGGVMAQWVQLYGLPTDDLRMIVRSFLTAFPATSVWYGSPGDIILLGRTDAAPMDLEQLRRQVESQPSVAADLARIGVAHWAELLAYFAMGPAEAARYAQGGGLNTDDLLPLEFSAPHTLYLNTALANLSSLRHVAGGRPSDVTPSSLALLGSAEIQYRVARGYARRGADADALSWFEAALAVDRQNVPALVGASQASLRLQRFAAARDFGHRALARDPENAEALHATALALMSFHQGTEAVPLLKRALAVDPGNPRYHEALSRAESGSTPR